MEPLNEEHELQVQAYLRFAKLKRDQHVRETLSVIRDFKSEKLSPGEMYNFKDLMALFVEMELEVQQLVDKEIQHAYHTNALLMKILLSQAQAGGLELYVDTNQLENELLLRAVAKSESVALARPASDFARRNAQLSKLGSVATITVQDGVAAKEVARLKAELATATERLVKLQEQTSATLRGRSAASGDVQVLNDLLVAKEAELQAALAGRDGALSQLQNEFQMLSTQASGAASSSQQNHSATQKQLAEQQEQFARERDAAGRVSHALEEQDAEVRQLKAILEGKLQDAPQVKQLRQLMQAKSNEVVDLRRRLIKYEPQSVPSADN
mmetsp:Transcript_19308/g.33336  ORF Transcript_19308/g.33336 Transcript_19308/m.33336 type:complete len:327 (-) Transcript_19308:235-1215(-)|eukprot:CAMPEP_0119102362 /NCGR_PEP_ID=MMETSP1180-20130426/1138_1 /TAXON_ID=3052 ORGANISM="Chlamydomonas cf sp, Strain CCMP681" /NCGR_SAMPLE_ID=MMETSP1180 /ASSEMBLY_ACC=CAM_ASM_000741 /LENGTH=326 /DNA_ID=CAMNT_0007086641 /DNA_START=92 /DNA_END=1072 /DNA_ORIENTATION=+